MLGLSEAVLIVPEPAASSVIPMLAHTRGTGVLKPGSSGQREASSGFPTIHQHVSFTFCVLPLLIDLTAYAQLTS